MCFPGVPKHSELDHAVADEFEEPGAVLVMMDKQEFILECAQTF